MTRDAGELLPGTFEMLTLKALSLGAMHGWGVAERIERLSDGVCEIQQGAVYPVLQRLLRRGWVVADWRSTEHNRRARYYRLTAAGQRQLDAEIAWWRRSIGGVDRVLRAATQEG
jgi:PadR family transcriptional regulator, regulatory protein PadR